MSEKIITSILCFCLSWTSISPAFGAPSGEALTESDIKARYPDAKVIHVSPEEYPALKEELRREGYQPASTLPPLGRKVETEGKPRHSARSVSDDCRDNEPNRRSHSNDDSLQVAVRVTDDLISDINWGKDGAALLFVIVGTVVVVVWALYVVKYLFDVAVGREFCGLWNQFTLSSTAVSLDSDQEARFSGVRYLTGFRDGSTDVGISVEIGRSDFRLTGNGSLDRESVYWLAGPVLRWRLQQDSNPHYFQMEFVAGSNEQDEIGTIASAKTGLNFGIGEGFRWGVNVGAMNIDINEGQGILTEGNEYYYLLGLELGYRF